MHLRRRCAAGVVASAVVVSSLTLASSPASAEDHQLDLAWVTAHDEPQPDAWRGVGALAPDGDWAIVNIDPGFMSGGEATEPGSSYLADLDAGTLEPLDGWVYSISDDGRIAVFTDWEGTFTVADLTAGTTREVAPSEELDQVVVSGDGSTLLLSFHAEYDAGHVVAIESVAGGERTIVTAAANQSSDRISHDGSTVLFDTYESETSTAHRWRAGSTIDLGDGQAIDASDDFDTILLREAFGTVRIWDRGVATAVLENTRYWLTAAVSGDGSTVAWFSDEGIERRNVVDGDDELIVELTEGDELYELELDADGDTIVYEPVIPSTGRTDLYLWRDGGGVEMVCCEDIPSEGGRTSNPAMLSDDGTRVLFASQLQIAANDPDVYGAEVFAWDVGELPPVKVSLRDTMAFEGSRHDVAVKLSRPVDHDVTVTVEGVDDDDWTILRNDVVIEAGEVWGYLPIVVWGDVEREEDETVTAHVVSVDGAELGDGTGGVKIIDEPPPTISIGDVRRQEWASAQYWKFPVTTDVYVREITVDLTTRNGGNLLTDAQAGLDYVAKTATVTIPTGSFSGQLVVQVNGDVIPELDETFTVEVTGVTGAVVGDGVGLGTIKDDDPQVTLPVRFR